MDVLSSASRWPLIDFSRSGYTRIANSSRCIFFNLPNPPFYSVCAAKCLASWRKVAQPERGLIGSCGMQMRGEGGGEDIGSAFCTTIKDVLPVALALPLSGSLSVSLCELRARACLCPRRSAGGNTNKRHRVLPLCGCVLCWRDGFVPSQWVCQLCSLVCVCVFGIYLGCTETLTARMLNKWHAVHHTPQCCSFSVPLLCVVGQTPALMIYRVREVCFLIWRRLFVNWWCHHVTAGLVSKHQPLRNGGGGDTFLFEWENNFVIMQQGGTTSLARKKGSQAVSIPSW